MGKKYVRCPDVGTVHAYEQVNCYLEQALCSPPGEEEPLLVQVEGGGLQLPGAQIYDSEEVEPGPRTITHFQPLSHTIRSKN
jgi:hypothetical protein